MAPTFKSKAFLYFPYGFWFRTREWRKDTIMRDRPDSKLLTYRMLERASDQSILGWLSDDDHYDARDADIIFYDKIKRRYIPLKPV
jgi:hypothetical protein